MVSDRFSSLPLSPEQLANLASLGYETMTPIQGKSLPLVLEGKDVIARAKTGSGKTAAFGIGLLESINPRFFGAQCLVLCPTRELADQVGKEIRRLARSVPNIKLVLLCGGKPFGPQVGSLEHGVHIVVGTPGRVQDHLRKRTLKLDGLKVLVLDEADRMLDMGFEDAMKDIVGRIPKKRQTLLFSATYPESIKEMSQSIQTDPVTVSVDETHKPNTITQWFYETNKHNRDEALLNILAHHKIENALVFCHTKIQCDEVAQFLGKNKISALALHGDLEQRERDQVLVRFANNSCSVLVATDVAARGLDIKSLQGVVNYELPKNPEIYVHRIGRTGRAGEKGKAVSMFTSWEESRVDLIASFYETPSHRAKASTLKREPGFTIKSKMTTIQLDSGRKNKIRPGDILGALTGDAGLLSEQIGKIDIFDMSSYVAIEHHVCRQALTYLSTGKIKGRSVRARKLG